jgi:hypothetical protein
MSIKTKVFAVSAALTLAGGIGAAGLLAPAANATTPSCGGNCVSIFSRVFGHHFHPGFTFDVYQQKAKVGQPVILFRQANNDPGQDFILHNQGYVSDFYNAGLVSKSLVLHYGGGCPVLTGGSCTTPNAADDYAFEIEYAPDGAGTGLCAGVASVASNSTKVSLQPCGVSARTVWISDTDKAAECGTYPVYGGVGDGYVPLINGSDTNFSHPYVLTYPQNGYPTDMPRPQLHTQELNGFTDPGGVNPYDPPATVNETQLWGVDGMPMPGPTPGCPSPTPTETVETVY